jgi:hypothetical protein
MKICTHEPVVNCFAVLLHVWPANLSWTHSAPSHMSMAPEETQIQTRQKWWQKMRTAQPLRLGMWTYKLDGLPLDQHVSWLLFTLLRSAPEMISPPNQKCRKLKWENVMIDWYGITTVYMVNIIRFYGNKLN